MLFERGTHMISTTSKWHVDRRKAIFAAHPELKLIPKHDSWTLAYIAGTFIIQCTVAYLSQFAPLWLVLVLAWSVGGLCAFLMHGNAHELSHRLVHPKIEGRLKNFMLGLGTLPSFTLMNFILYRWGHLTHHANLGSQSVAQAKDIFGEEQPDIELLMAQYYYEIVFEKDGKPRRLVSERVIGNPVLKLVYFISIPVQSMLLSMLMQPVIIAAFVKSFFGNKTRFYKERAASLTLQLLNMYGMLAGFYIVAGYKALVYLFFAELFLRGFLFYPSASFFMTGHKSFGNEKKFQPTCNVKGWVNTLVSVNSNLHVEHHDFPDCPRRYLPVYEKVAPEFYKTLHSYPTLRAAFIGYLKDPHWVYGGDFQKLGEATQGDDLTSTYLHADFRHDDAGAPAATPHA